MKPAAHSFLISLAFAFIAIFFAGCDEDRDFATSLGNNPQADGNEVEEAIKAKTKADAANLAKIKANVQAAKKANGDQPPGKATTVVNGELSLAENRLEGVDTSKTEASAADERKEAVYQGRAEEAARLYSEANKQAGEELAKRVLAEAKLADAIEKQQAEREQFAKEVDRLKAYAAKLENAEKAKQVLTLRLIGVGFIVIFGLAVGFGHIAGLRLGWVFGVIGLLFLGVAQVVAFWWFKWACAGLVGCLIVLCGWWVYQRHRENTLAEDLKKKAGTLKKLVPILDDAYDSISDEQKELKAWVDSKIFGALSGMMDKGTDKAAIHQVRAENAEGK